MALPAPLIPNFSGLLNNYAVGYEQADAMRKRNLLLEAGALAAGGAPTVSPSLTQGSSPAAYQAGSLVDRIVGAESGGNATARNPNSSATGAGQFIASTWLDMIRRHRPDLAAGKAPAEILALRNDPNLSREMTGAYAAENSRALQSAGLPVTDGTQYLSHFAGPAGARSVLSADPSTPVSRLLQPAAVRANPFLANMTAGDLRNWADRKVGGAPAAPGGGLAAASNVLLRGGEINAGLALQDRMRAQEKEAEAKASEKQKEMWGYIGDLALTADTPEKWARAISVAKNYGLNVDGLDDFAARDLVLARSGRMKTALDMQAEQRKAPADYEFTKYGVGNKRTGALQPYAQGATPSGDEFNKNIVFGIDDQGNQVPLQFSDQGRAVQSQMPAGVRLGGKNPVEIDAKTETILLDPVTRQVIGRIPKDIAGAQAQEEIGKAQGQAVVDLPRQLANAEQSLKVINQIRMHPGRKLATGTSGILPGVPGTQQRDFIALLDQAKGKAFLEAFNSLKGGGAITEVEGAKATQAIARLERTQSEQGFLNALKDLEDVVTAGLERAKQKAAPVTGTSPVAAPSVDLNAVKQKYGLE